MNMEFLRRMPTAEEVRAEYPLTEELIRRKQERDKALRDILTGADDRFIMVIGPCSADRRDAILEYLGHLRTVQEKVADRILIVPRLYTNKPRTTGDGYKGMQHQPDPSHSPDLKKGIYAARELHVEALEETGFSCADEMLYPEEYGYLSDCLSYVTVGARSVENQMHRLTASGLDIPVGMKNPTGGNLRVMLNSVTAAQHSHTFAYCGWEVKSHGNPLAHAVLRGSSGPDGNSVPNYRYEDLERLCTLYEESGLQNPAVIVDTNHANSGKQYAEQPRIAREVLHSMRQSERIGKLVKGLMVESYLEDGCQKPDGKNYGQSITDPCLGWEKTERMILEIAETR